MGWREPRAENHGSAVLTWCWSPVRGQPREFPTRPRPATRETRRTSPPSSVPRGARARPGDGVARVARGLGRWTHWPRSWCMCPRRRWWARWMRRTELRSTRRRRQGARVRRQGARVARARPGDGVPRVASGLARQAAREGVGACAHGAVGGRDGCVAKRSEHSHVTDIVEGAADAVVLSGADRHASPVRGHRYRRPRVVDRILTVDVAANLGPRPAALRVHAHVAAVGVVLGRADGHTRAVRRHRYLSVRPAAVARSLAVDVAANLGPRPAALRVHAHMTGEGAGAARAVVQGRAYRHASAV